jgi:hypothetical protein
MNDFVSILQEYGRQLTALETENDRLQTQVDSIREMLSGPGDSCGGYEITSDGCYVKTLAERITAVLDGAK